MKRALRVLASAVAVHGLLFAIGSVTLARMENPALGELYFVLVIAPALILALPFTPILWHLHLIEAPGWFAWPRPLGFALVYGAWIAAFLAASFVRVRR